MLYVRPEMSAYPPSPGSSSPSGGWGSPPQGGGWGPPPPGGGWGPPPSPQTNGKATAALILGILGFVVCPLVCSVLALVFGYQARNEIDASRGYQGGRGMAVAGIVLGWVGIAVMILLILLWVGLFAGSMTSESV